MSKHAIPAGPEGDAIRKQFRRQRAARAREWLVVFFFPLTLPLDFASSSGARWHFYPIFMLEATILVIAASFANSYASRLSLRTSGPRPRAVYLLLACACGAVAAACAIIGRRLGDQAGWQADALGEAMVLGGGLAVVMFGRAVTWGWVRRCFWLHPPGGTGGGRASAVANAPDQAQG